MKKCIILMIACIFPACSGIFSANETFRTEYFKIEVDSKGFIKSLYDISSGTEYLAAGQPAPLMSVRSGGEMETSAEMTFDKTDNTISLFFYETGFKTKIKVEEKDEYICFELLSAEPKDKVELIVWGPYPVTIREIIGETVGVVRNGKFAIGIQALNVKTMGGYPSGENDVMPSYNIFAGSDYKDIDEKDREKKLFRGETARPKEFGSVLQAYCRNRDRDRIIKNWNHDRYFVPAYDDGGVTGSKIALFGCAEDKTLEIIGKIEVNEGLPHPVIDGKWGKVSPTANASYLIMDFGEDNIDEALKYTKTAGLKYLYHGEPFETWGHFKLRKQHFPGGMAGLKRCVEKARKQEVGIGVHTLSNFITTNDPYVTPVPDKRLARVGTTVLTENIDKNQKVITIKDPGYFNQMKNNSLKTVMIGSELIRYGSVSEEAPWQLIDCVRGAFGTKAASHKEGEETGKLIDHAYKVFLTGIEMLDEMAVNIADLFNEAGLVQISFDGLEGCWSTGMGQYARTMYVKKWYDSLSDDLRGKVITDASNPGHYFWHMFTRMNWGEPWYAGFRESQTQYRLKNQEFFSRNLMPGMLGWFKLTAQTSLEDIEWLLARAAGFNAGFSLVASIDVLEKNGLSTLILDKVKQWENARLTGLFTAEQKEALKDINREFQFEKSGDQKWSLIPVYGKIYNHDKKIRQPGEPVSSTFKFDNPGKEQSMKFVITAPAEAAVSGMTIEIDNYKKINLQVKMKPGQILKYEGGEKAVLYDKNWNAVRSIKINPDNLTVAKGLHEIVFDCSFSAESKSPVKLELKTFGNGESVKMD